MRSVDGSERMAMRIHAARAHRRWGPASRRCAAPGLGRWRSSRPGVGAFGYKQVVRNLAEGSLYRVRWTTAGTTRTAQLIGQDAQALRHLPRAQTRSRTCGCASWASATRAAADTDRYCLQVTNFGAAAAAEGVPVRLSVDGAVAASGTVGALLCRRARGRELILRAPECENFVQAQVDPDGLIAETVETDNSHSAGLPGPPVALIETPGCRFGGRARRYDE